MGPRCIRFDNDSINLDNVGKFGLNVAVGWLFVAGRIYGLGGQNCREKHGSMSLGWHMLTSPGSESGDQTGACLDQGAPGFWSPELVRAKK